MPAGEWYVLEVSWQSPDRGTETALFGPKRNVFAANMFHNEARTFLHALSPTTWPDVPFELRVRRVGNVHELKDVLLERGFKGDAPPPIKDPEPDADK